MFLGPLLGHVCSLPAWNFSEAPWDHPHLCYFPSSALFSQPDPICFLSFRVSLNFWSLIGSFKCFLALLLFHSFKNLFTVLPVGLWKGRKGVCVWGGGREEVKYSVLNSPILFLHGLSYFLHSQKLTFWEVFHIEKSLNSVWTENWAIIAIIADLTCYRNTGSGCGTAATPAWAPGYKCCYLAPGHSGGPFPWSVLWQKALVTCFGSLFSRFCSDLGAKAPVGQLFLQLRARGSSVVWIS